MDKIKQTLIDKAIGVFDPIRAAHRLKARSFLALAGGYTGASRSRRSLKEWRPLGGDADSDILRDLPTLRERSRDLIRNNPTATGAINTITTSVIGPGLKLKSTIDREFLGLTDEQGDDWERQAERLWNLWSNSEECDATRTQTFSGIQDLVFRSTLENGDTFVLLPMFARKGSPFGLKLQVVEADRVENKDFARDTTTRAGGVELDSRGAPKNYHILKAHPGNITRKNRKWQVIPAFGANTGRRNVLHLYRKLRPGQTRGVPLLAPVIESLKQLGRYTDAELMAAVVSGMFTVFIKTEAGDADLATFAPDDITGGKDSDEDYKLGNGAIVGLAQGEDITTTNPGRPNGAFDPFILAISRQIGAAIELPYELLIKHFTASYSASRAALLEAWRFFNARRAWVVSDLCNPVYKSFIGEQVAAGRLQAPGFFDDPLIQAAYLGAMWTGRPQGHIQPLQEANAIEKRLTTKVSSLAMETAEASGADWEDVHRQIAKEQRMMKESGLQSDPIKPNQKPPVDKNDPKDKEENGVDDETA